MVKQSSAKRYVGTATVAAWFGVLSSTVLKWREKYSDFPPPDVEIQTGGQIVYGWDPNRRRELIAWCVTRPGQGHRSDLHLYQQDALAREFITSCPCGTQLTAEQLRAGWQECMACWRKV